MSAKSKLLAFFFGFSLSLLTAEAQTPPTRIMPLGDSITHGGDTGSYRRKLYQLLTSAGYNVDFVGTQNNGVATLPDRDHEGRSGWTIRQIDANIAGWLGSIEDPDLILLHIGTNDFGTGDDTTNAIHRLDALVTKMATLRPYAHIIVTNLMERNEPQNSQIQSQFNPFVENLVNSQVSQGRRVSFLDMRSAVPLSEMPDQLHPNQAGYDHMADAWFPAIQAVTGPLGDNHPPEILRALGHTDLTQVTITFSKPVADSAADPGKYTLSGGLTVSAASLDSSKRKVTLTTSPQAHGETYTITIHDLVDRTPSAWALAPDSTVNFFGATARGYANNVPESAGYTLAYSLDIPNVAFYSGSPVNYTVDNHHAIGPFSRIAYYLELQSPHGDLQYLWASMNAFTADARKIGVPILSSEAVFQQSVTGMNVVSNVPGIATGTGLTGNLEFWPTNYDTPNAGNVPGASGSTFDFGDIRSATGSYGSMQLHHTAAGQTLFAFNNWGGLTAGSQVDLGIGNNPGANPDWTFSNNGSSYTVKTLQVLVQTIGDSTPPSVSSAAATHGRTQVIVRFSEALSPASVKPEHFSLDHDVAILGATLAPNQRDVYLLTTPQTPGVSLTLTVHGVRDSSPSANPIPPGSSIAVAEPALPPEIVSNVGAASEGYHLVASIELPIQGNLNASSAAYTLDDRLATGAFSKVAYYLELQKPGEAPRYVWTSMDAFTASRAKLCFPTVATGAFFQQNVTHLSVLSNVPGVVNGTTASSGNIEMWPGDYIRENGAGVPLASGSVFDTGDTPDNGRNAGYGSMQVHNHDAGANQTVFSVNRFGRDGLVLDVGIGNNPSGSPDWTYASNAGEYERRVLHVLVLPGAALPPGVEANVPAAAGYQLVYSLNIPATGNANSLAYSVNRSAEVGPFTRIGYYMELQTGASTPSYVWVSMDAFTANAAHIGVPTQASGAFFQRHVANMEVVSNADGIVNGSIPTGGNIEFWSGNYNQSNQIGIPNASGSVFDFGDGGAERNAGYGSMQVHNHAASQTLFAFNRFGSTSGTNPFCLGIGNNPSGSPDWTFADNSTSYSSRILHVFVLPGNPDATGPAVVRAIPSVTLNRLIVAFDEEVSDSSAAPANFDIPGLTVTDATLLPGRKEIALATTAQTPGTTYMVHVSGVRDRSISGNPILPDASTTFVAYTAPAVLENVPETGDYRLVYRLAIPTARPSWNLNAIPYEIDEARYGEQLFDRVAYLLELDGNWAYASFDRHTSSIAKTGVPNTSVSLTPFQRTVSNLNVLSNVPGVVTGTGLTGGNIEFWAGNYSAGNALGIPNASESTLDFGDTMGSGNFGCMQVHNHEASQTILAFNNWGESVNGTINLGIGNNPNAGSPGQGGTQMPDWTFTPNAPNFTTRNLYVLVRPGGSPSGAAPLLLSQTTSRLISPGDSTTLSVSATGGVAPLTYQWRFNGVPIPGATEPWYDIVSADDTQGGSYDVVVTGSNLAFTTSTAIPVVVNHPPVVDAYRVTTRRNTPVSISRAAILAKATDAEGQSLDITSAVASSSQGGSVALGDTDIVYTPATGFLGADSFTVTVSDGFGGSTTGTVHVTVTAAGAISSGQSILAIRTDGKVDLLFSAAPATEYDVQRSVDLLPEGWSTLATIPSGDDGLIPFTDPDPPAGKAFYRVSIPQN